MPSEMGYYHNLWWEGLLGYQTSTWDGEPLFPHSSGHL